MLDVLVERLVALARERDLVCAMIALTFSTVWATFLINLIFGISTTLLYWKLERRGDEQSALQHAR